MLSRSVTGMNSLTGLSTPGDASLTVMGGAFLLLNVKGLTHTDRDVDVQINGSSVGKICHYGGRDETKDYWFTQMIHFPSNILNDGDNRIEIRAVTWPGATPSNRFDDFWLKDVICFFKQEV
jgi:hypothetical protein